MRKFLFGFCLILIGNSAFALPPDGMVYALKSSVVKIRVILPNGHYGVGSGVVVAQDQVVTNCHVIANAHAINVIKFGESHRAVSLKADWEHDLCIVGFDGLNTTIATLGESTSLQYEQSVFTISFPNNSPRPLTTYGAVKALYPMDDSVIIRTTNDFRLGASGGAMFSDDGKLVGIITLKSPGRNAFYYNMPVEWIKNLLKQPEIAINTKGELPFWDAPEEKRPYFMRVIQPYQTEDWVTLKRLANEWIQDEPEASEALNYLAIAEYNLKETHSAANHFGQLYAQNKRHANALLHLGLIATDTGNKNEAIKTAALLNELDKEAASQINTKLELANNNDCQASSC
ncbi:MAG: serine protease [Methylotenera sp.]|nr:serine protease [Methylotenera sp.]